MGRGRETERETGREGGIGAVKWSARCESDVEWIVGEGGEVVWSA